MSGSDITNVSEIGSAAGQVWEYLHRNGPASVNKMVTGLGLTRDVLLQAIGWLAREDKLLFEKANRGRRIRLK